MSAAPLPSDEAERLKALARYDILDTGAEDEFDDFTRLASLICKTPVALITLLDASRQWFKSKVGTDVTETPRELAFCGYAILGSELMEVPNAVEDARFRDNALVTGAPDIRFYAGMPLITPDGFKLGTLCVIDRVPRHLTSEQADALARLGRQVVRQLELRLVNRRQQETGAFQRGILECANYSIISTSPDGIIRTFNRAAEQMLGYRAEEVVGKFTPEFIHDRDEVIRRAAELTEELGRTVPAGFETFVAKARTGRAYEQEWTYVRQDGTRFPVQLSITAMRDEAGKITGFLGIAHDITRRREAQARVRQLTSELEERVQERTAQLETSEERLRLAQQAARVGTFELNLSTGVNIWSPELEAMHGLPLGTFGGTLAAWEDLVHADDRAQVKSLVLRAFGTREPVEGEWRVVWPDGSTHWLFGRFQVFRNLSGQPHRLTGVNLDITERKRADRITATQADLGRQLSVAGTRPAAAAVILKAADQLLPFDAALLHLLSPDRRRVYRVLTVDTLNGSRTELPVTYEAEAPSLMFQRVLIQGAQLVLRNGQKDIGITFEAFGDRNRKSSSLMFVPLRAGENVLGILSLQSYMPHAYTPANLAMLQALADHAAGAFERLEAEETLAESEQRFRGTFEQAAVGVAHVDLDGRWLLVNDWVCNLVGYPRTELMRKTFQDITHPDDLGPDLDCVQRLLAGQIQHYGLDKRYFHKDGSIIWVHLSGSLIRKADGTPHYFISIIQDIRTRKTAEEALRQAHEELENRVQQRTAELALANNLLHTEVNERRSMEAALRESETRLRTVIDSTPDWIFIKDTQFKFRLVNRSLAEAFHLSPDDFIGRDDLEMGAVTEIVLGNPAKGIRGFRADDREVMETGCSKTIPEELGTANGQPVVLNTVKVPLRDTSGKVIGLLGYVHDITERKAMEEELAAREEQLRDMFENATDLIQSVAPDGRILFVNRAWLNTLGYRMSELAGLNIFDVCHPDCLAEYRAQFQRVMQGEALSNLQAAFRTKRGEKIHVEGNASCRMVDGKPVASRAIFRDVTKRKAVEAERERLITELQAALAEVKTLSGLLPICGWCKKIRDDSGYWNSVEGYLKKSTGADLTHGICPECSAKMMAELDNLSSAPAGKSGSKKN